MMLMVLLLSQALYAQSVTPGIWQADSSVEISGLPLPPSTDKNCITADEAKDIKGTIVKELDAQGCVPTKWIVKGEKLEIALKCTKSGLQATGNMHGSITDKSYNISGEAEGTYQSIPAQANIKLTGKWIKACAK